MQKIASLTTLLLAACGTPAQATPAPTPSPSHTPTVTPTASHTPQPTITPSITPADPPTITAPPTERDDHPARVPPVALDPGGFLSWSGTVEQLVDNQDWVAVYVSSDPEGEATFDVEMPCGGGDTARVALFEAGVVEGVDADGDGTLSYEEALETGAAIPDFDLPCLGEKSIAVSGDAEYYLVVYAAFGGQTGYSLFLSR